MGIAAKRIYYVCGKSKESVRKSARALCVWDSGSVIVLVMDLLMQPQAGTQWPGSTWKKYHPHRLETTSRVAVVIVFGLTLRGL